MERDFEIKIGDDGLPYQTFNGRKYKLYPNRRYFIQHKHHMHHIVWEHYNGKRTKGFHVHHIDGNSWNNKPSNLALVKAKDHMSKHASERLKSNPEHRIKFHTSGIQAAKEWHKSEEGKEWHLFHAKRFAFGKKNEYTNTCEQCGKVYTYYSPNPNGKFCHPNCKAKALRRRRKMAGKSL